MTKKEFRQFSEEFKKVFQKMLEQKDFEPVIKFLYNKFENVDYLNQQFELDFYATLCNKKGTKIYIPLCFIGTSRTLENKFGGISYGIIPKLPADLELQLKVVKKGKTKKVLPQKKKLGNFK